MQAVYLQCYKNRGNKKKNLLGLVLGIDIPSPLPTAEKDFPLAKWQCVSGPSLQKRSKWAMFLYSVAMGNTSFFFLLMSNLGFSLRYLPFGRPACHCSTGNVSWPCQLLGFAGWLGNQTAYFLCMEALFYQICLFTGCLVCVFNSFDNFVKHNGRCDIYYIYILPSLNYFGPHLQVVYFEGWIAITFSFIVIF